MIILEPIAITDAVLASSNVTEDEYPIWSSTGVYGPGERVIYIAPDVHDVYQSLLGTTAPVVISVGSPGVITWVAHGLANGAPVKFMTTGALPTGLASGATYFVVGASTNTFNVAATVGGAAINTSGTQSGTHTAASNLVGLSPPANATYWVRKGVDNRWAMFDGYSNTQTTNADSIQVSLTPTGIVGGVYLGNVDAVSIDVTVVDAIDGTVYTRSDSMIQANSGSSFYNWCFRRIVRRNVFVAIDLPMYANPTINISINNAGATAKCGMCRAGPLLDVGMTLYGVGTDIKDFSTTTFDVDGTSTTVQRGFVKRMTLDVLLENDVIDSVQDMLASYRQTNVVWIAEATYRWTVQHGKFSSFKNVIQGETHSQIALTIESTV